DGSVIQPRAWMPTARWKRKFRSGKDRPANLSSGNTFSQASSAALKAKYLGDSQKHVALSRGLYHLPAFFRIHGHRLLAEHRLAMFNGDKNIPKMKRIGCSDENRVHFRRPAQIFRGIERQGNTKLPRGFLCFLQIAARQRGYSATCRVCETRHQTLDRMQSEANDAETDHGSAFMRKSAEGYGMNMELGAVPVDVDPLVLNAPVLASSFSWL